MKSATFLILLGAALFAAKQSGGTFQTVAGLVIFGSFYGAFVLFAMGAKLKNQKK